MAIRRRLDAGVFRVPRIALPLGVLLLAACLRGGRASGEATVVADGTCTIERVTDGDTVVCTDGIRVRLLLIDTPELDQGEYGRAARSALLEMLPPGTVAAMEFDVQRLDQYGRTLAYLYTPEGVLVNVEMALRGYAVALTYPPNVRYVERVREAVTRAREAGRGLWADNGFECEPRQHRRGTCE